MSKLFYTRFTKLITDYFLSCNKNIPCRSDSKMHSEGDDLPITKLSNNVDADTSIQAKKVKVESKGSKEPIRQNEPPVKSRRGKGYMCSGENEANVPKLFEKNVVPRKTRSLNVTEEIVAAELAKSISIKEQCTQQLRRIQLTTNSQIDEDVADTYAEWGQKLKRCSSNKHFTIGNVPRRECSSFIISTNNYNIPSYQNSTTKLTPSQRKEANVKGKKDMRKINFKKSVAQKFRDYDMKLEALTNFNIFEAFEKAIQERFLTKIKTPLPTHIPKPISNYVRPCLNSSMLEIMQNNQISLFTKSSTSIDNLLDMDLKLKLLNRIHENCGNRRGGGEYVFL
ncbi:hypothetical protein Tco_0153945 [Tanacetum coccineum]